MRFADHATVFVEAGRGGDGRLSFQHTLRNPGRGGPDGGNGSSGGSVFLVADEALNTLVDYRYRRIFHAQPGGSGGSSNCTGKKGADLMIKVPLGTRAKDEQSGELLGTLDEPGATLLVAKGGAHGFGNTHFKSSTRRSPKQTTRGSDGESRHLRLEFRLIADAGLVGVANSGRSSLLRALSSAQPEVADYPHTTRVPTLGVVQLEDYRRFTLVDVPSIHLDTRRSAASGSNFLRHLEHCKILLWVVECAVNETDGAADAPATAARVRALLEQSRRLHPTLERCSSWLLLNKIDRVATAQRRQFCHTTRRLLDWSKPLYGVSALHGQGLAQLREEIMEQLDGSTSDNVATLPPQHDTHSHAAL